MLQSVDKGYLKTLLFGVAEDAECTRLIEVRGPTTITNICKTLLKSCTQVYKFNFVYSTGGAVAMNIDGPHGETQLLQLNKVCVPGTQPGLKHTPCPGCGVGRRAEADDHAHPHQCDAVPDAITLAGRGMNVRVQHSTAPTPTAALLVYEAALPRPCPRRL